MKVNGWKRESIGELCDFSNGHGFGPKDWAGTGLPIIRIQNLNGTTNFNYFQGTADPSWLVHSGTLLFAWAGTKGVSFGPTVWNGPLGVLNQHIYRVHPKESVDDRWLFLALRRATDRIERMAHGFKSTLLHVGKDDITGQVLDVPSLPEQHKIADILTTWDEASGKLDALIEAKDRRKKAIMQQLLAGTKRPKGTDAKLQFLRASVIFTNHSERNSDGLPILSVTQDQGIVLRSSLERRIAHDEGNANTYKVVHAGDFVISLRSFQGGLEYSNVTGAVSPAYHIIRPIKEIDRSFFRHYFKSADFVSRLATAVIGIRDGKQVNFTDFGFIKLPYPSLSDQKRIGCILDICDRELTLLRTQRTALDQQKRGLMQRLLTGKLRVKT